MKKKTFITAIALLMLLAVLVLAVLVDALLSTRRSIGIIGGADGSTSIIVGETIKTDPVIQTEQLMVIAANKEVWMPNPEYANDISRYAITDLDWNGRYEIIVCNHGGTGQYTYSRFFEVNENLDGLTVCETDFVEGDSEPDLIFETQLNTYIDTNGAYHYAVYDSLKNGAAEYYENYRALTLKDGKITTVPIAYKSTLYEAENISFTDAEGNEISEEDYKSAADRYFAGYQKTVTALGWQEVSELAEAPEEIAAQLKISVQIFTEKIQKQ